MVPARVIARSPLITEAVTNEPLAGPGEDGSVPPSLTGCDVRTAWSVPPRAANVIERAASREPGRTDVPDPFARLLLRSGGALPPVYGLRNGEWRH
jgi:hypothetical protein